MRMLTRRIALIAAVSVATLSAGGRPPSPPAPAGGGVCFEIGCVGSQVLCATFTTTLDICLFGDCWEIDIRMHCYQSLG